MSTICGVFSRRGNDPEELGIDAMLAALPGKHGNHDTWADKSVILACRRLTITPEQPAGGLPRHDAKAGLTITADVRLDDRGALCDKLGIPAAQGAGMTDGELILGAYERWGPACVEHLLGDYAFVIWDAREQTAFCARDHIGARSFYYSVSADQLVFASNIDAVLAASGVSDTLDETTIANQLSRRNAAAERARTYFRAVRKLPPGQWLTVGRETMRLTRWWCPERVPAMHLASDDAYAEAFLDLYKRAVHDRLGGTESVGVHLSGGLDSSSIAVLAARELRRQGRPPPPAFTWLSPPPTDRPRDEHEANEYGLVETICAQENLPVFHQSPGPGDIVAALRRDVARGSDESTLIHEEIVQRRAAEQGVQVLLSGWGGDEGVSFNGRGYESQLLLHGHLGALLRLIRAGGPKPFRRFLYCLMLLLSEDERQAVNKLRRGQWPFRERNFLDPAFARQMKPRSGPGFRYTSVRSTQLKLLELGHLSRRLEGWSWSGARHGIEYRYPLLDRRLLEFALGLPPEQYRRGRWSRWLMRHGLRSVLPPEVCWNRSKQDPARLRPMRAALEEALPIIHRELVSRAAPPSRAHYLDMPRLLKRLRMNEPFPVPQIGLVTDALRFLDF